MKFVARQCSELEEINFDATSGGYSLVFKTFKKHYQLVPLEVFSKDSYKTLISTILSSRTKDETTLEASKRLFEKADSIDKLKSLDIKSIEKLIYPVGFYNSIQEPQ